MFFAHELLVGPKGKFTLIWRAAVKKEKLKRRQLDTLDVSDICKSLIHYIKPRGDARMGSITGFSLRLSAQLVYGVIVCYNWKVSYMLDDAISSWKAVIVTKRLLQDLTLPKEQKTGKSRNATNKKLQLDIRFDADPMFGETYGGDLDILPQILPLSTSEESTSTSSDDRKKRRSSRMHAVTDVSEITMQEEVPTPREGGDILYNAEVAPFDLDELANMNNQETGFLDSALPKDIPVVPEDIPVVPQPTTPAGAVLTETPVMPKPPKRRRMEEKPEESILAVPLPEEAPVIEPSPLVLDPMGMYELPIRKQRKTRKLIIDPKIERSAAEIKKQLGTRNRTIQDYREEGLLNEPLNLVPVDVLFAIPTLQSSGFDTSRVEAVRDVSAEDMSIIRNMFNSTIQNVSGFLGLQESELRERSNAQLADDPSFGVVRDASKSTERLDASIHAESLSIAEHAIPREHTRRSQRTRVSGFRQSDIPSIDITPAMDVQSVAEQPAPEDILEPLPVADLLDVAEETVIHVDETSVLDEVEKLLQSRDGVTTFAAVAPPGMITKSQAAKRFYSLLVHAKAGRVELSQESGFAEIEISVP